MENLGAPNGSGAGRTLGRYELLYALSAGGFGQVYAACARSTAGFRTLMAVKILHPSMLMDQSTVKAFADEARLGGRLLHPNIARVFEFAEQDGQYYLVLELIDGLNFSDLVKQYHEVGIANALELVAQACDGLQYAHEARDDEGAHLGLVHRDLKPPNLMLDRSGFVKVMDFGIARTEFEGRDRTLTGMLKGTPAYMAPEAARGETKIDHRVDIFALGLVLYELLTGSRLYGRGTPMAMLHVAATGQYLKTLDGALKRQPPEVAEILTRSLTLEPEARYGSAHEMGRACRQVARAMEVGPDIRALAKRLAPRAIHVLPSETGLLQAQLEREQREIRGDGAMTEVDMTSAELDMTAVRASKAFEPRPEHVATRIDGGKTIKTPENTQNLATRIHPPSDQTGVTHRMEAATERDIHRLGAGEAATAVLGAKSTPESMATEVFTSQTSLEIPKTEIFQPGADPDIPATAVFGANSAMSEARTELFDPTASQKTGLSPSGQMEAKASESKGGFGPLKMVSIAGLGALLGAMVFIFSGAGAQKQEGDGPAVAALAATPTAEKAATPIQKAETPAPTPEKTPVETPQPQKRSQSPKTTAVAQRPPAQKPASTASKRVKTRPATTKVVAKVAFTFNTAPEEQVIFIDGKQQSTRTPWKGELAAGKHRIAVGSASGPSQVVDLKAGKAQTWLAIKNGANWEFVAAD